MSNQDTPNPQDTPDAQDAPVQDESSAIQTIKFTVYELLRSFNRTSDGKWTFVKKKQRQKKVIGDSSIPLVELIRCKLNTRFGSTITNCIESAKPLSNGYLFACVTKG